MKKAFLTIALAAFAFAANAQFVVGGQIGFNTTGGNTSNHTQFGTVENNWTVPATGRTQFQLMPKIGYQLNDKMQVGAQLGLTYNWTKNYDVVSYFSLTNPVSTGYAYTAAYDKAENWRTRHNFGFAIAPYFRYNVTEFGKFTLFCEAQITLALNGKQHYHDFATEVTTTGGTILSHAIDTTYVGNTNSGSLAITVTPGLNYKFNDNISADLYIDLLGLGFTHAWTKTYVDASTGSTTSISESHTSNNDFYFIANANAQTLQSHLSAFRLGFNYHF